jgi:nucleotide-binding universal stress UspA family protein
MALMALTLTGILPRKTSAKLKVGEHSMATKKSYLVPVDFSKPADIALDHAIQLARENKAGLILLHIIADRATEMAAPEGVSPALYVDYEKIVREEANMQMQKLLKKKKLGPKDCRALFVRRGDPARAIADQAKKLKASMIVMGSHGRTGLKRLVLGSVAERTLRYARCPVMIVKK